MIPELGFSLLILAMLCASLPLLVFKGRLPGALIRTSTYLQFTLIIGAFLCLMFCFLWSDFSVEVVVNNSHTLKPLLYKIGGVWGNHEGSMLLWVLVLTLFASLVGVSRTLADDLKTATLSVQSFITFLFLAFICFASNPFKRIDPPAIEGNDLNPLLQDPGLVFHPPLLYIGYVGLSLIFSFALGGLFLKKVDRAWALAIKPWVMVAWSALGAGIALGSWWAYYELGWGGFWFWDPVENASLMPWLLATALLHSILVIEKRGGFIRWSILLALLAFAFSMLGTFLVRSGVLTSVHAFALDPGRGSLLLLILFILLGYALYKLARDWDIYAANITIEPLSRENMLLLNNLFLCTITATIFIGTLYPLFLSVLDAGAVAVGPPYFHTTVFPLAAPMFALMGVAALVPWKAGKISSLRKPVTALCGFVIFGVILIAVLNNRGPWLAIPAFGFSLWVLSGAVLAYSKTLKIYGHILKIPLHYSAMSLAHLSVAIALIGMIGVGLWRQEAEAVMIPGQKLQIGGYTLTLNKIDDVFKENYIAAQADFSIRKNGELLSNKALPEKRYYPSADTTTTEADIILSPFNDLYVVLGEVQPGLKGWAVKAWVHPLAGLLWAGFAGIVLSGALSTFAAFTRKEKS